MSVRNCAQCHHPSHQAEDVSLIDSKLTTDVDVLVIGAGQAGLAAGITLRHAGLRFMIVDAGDQPGGSWPWYYDSLTLFSPARFSTLPGLRLAGRLSRYPTRDDMARYLRDYATHFQLPVLAGPIARNLQVAALGTWGCTARGDDRTGSRLPNRALLGSWRRASAARPAPRVLLRAGLAPAFCGRGDVTQERRAAGVPARGACTRPAGCGRRRSGARSFRGRRPGSRRRCVLRPWPR